MCIRAKLDKVTQQNAGASEQMSATSEELAAQAEELQASISFFKVDQVADHAASRPVAASARIRTAPAPAQRGRLAPVGAKAGNHSVASQQARAKGFALDLTMDGPDAVDDDFRNFA